MPIVPPSILPGAAGFNLVQTYKPGYQVDGTVGIVYTTDAIFSSSTNCTSYCNSLDRAIVRDGGDAANPRNSGFDRVVVSPGANSQSSRRDEQKGRQILF